VYWSSNNLDRTWCSVSRWCQHLGFAVCFGAALLKNYRISVIFSSIKNQAIRLGDAKLGSYLAVIISVFVLYLIIWTVAAPITANYIEFASIHNVQKSEYARCLFATPDWVMLAIECSMMLWGMYISYQVRNTPNSFNEAKYISFAIYNWMLLTALYFILEIAVSGSQTSPDFSYATLSFYIIMVYGNTVILLFVPKIYAVYTDYHTGRSTSTNPKKSGSASGSGGGGTNENEDRVVMLERRVHNLTRENTRLKEAMLMIENPHAEHVTPPSPMPSEEEEEECEPPIVNNSAANTLVDYSAVVLV